MSFTLRSLAAAAAAGLLASCGGGGGTPPSAGPPPVTISSGVAVDGYLKFATVLCDSNGNGSSDVGEREVGTNASGQFSFSPECPSALVVRGGTNADTGLPFNGVLKAPAGSKVVSPLTTLLGGALTAAQLKTSLGLADGIDLPNTDPALVADGALVNPTLYRKTLALQQLVQKGAELFGALAGQPSADAQRRLYTAVAAVVAQKLAAEPPLSPGMTLDPAVLTRLVAAAATEAAKVYAFTTPVNADALAQTVAGALAAQAESLLNASAGELVAKVTAAQGSTRISDFVLANAAQLNKAPDAATATLAAQLTGQVDPFLALAQDSLKLVNGATTTTYTIAQFQSDAGIAVAWPLPEPLKLEVTLARAENFAPAAGQKVSAAVSVTETAAGGKGTILAYIDNVDVTRSASAVTLTVPVGAAAKVYGVSSDGSKTAIIDFKASVANVTGTFNTAAGVPTSIPLGNIVNYGINQLSNDFTGIYGLRGKYKVTIVLAGLSLRKADGSLLTPLSISVPTSLNSTGAVATSHKVEGRGLQGFISLVD